VVVRAFADAASGDGMPWVLATRPLPGRTCEWNIPPWWSVELKSFEDSTMTTPWFQA
jgi:hypothetical protein